MTATPTRRAALRRTDLMGLLTLGVYGHCSVAQWAAAMAADRSGAGGRR